MTKIAYFLFKNKLAIILFFLSTSFFIYQHATNLSWDFASYSLNSQYVLNQGDYYEHYRPPLMTFTLSLLSIFTSPVAEYLFIILVSLLFCYTSNKLGSFFSMNQELFYLFSLSPFVLLHGLINGTELLSLALLELFLIFTIKEKPYAGLFLGLAALTRYNFIIFIILIFINKDMKKVIKNALFFALPFIPWLIYSFYKTGNILTSFADLYAIGFKFRDYIFNSVNSIDFIGLSGLLLITALIGLVFLLYNFKNSIKTEKTAFLVLIITVLALYQFYFTPLKVIRYLFPLVLPIAYFSVLGINFIKSKSKKIFIFTLIILLLFNAVYFSIMLSIAAKTSKQEYQIAIDKLEELGIKNCKVSSNEWVMLNYLGKPTEIFPRKELLQKRISEGSFIIFFYKTPEPEWAKDKSFLKQFPILYESKNFIILGKNERCNPEGVMDKTYVELTSREVNEIYNYTINTNPCFTFFDKSHLLEKTCNFVNSNGFKVDENRQAA